MLASPGTGLYAVSRATSTLKLDIFAATYEPALMSSDSRRIEFEAPLGPVQSRLALADAVFEAASQAWDRELIRTFGDCAAPRLTEAGRG